MVLRLVQVSISTYRLVDGERKKQMGNRDRVGANHKKKKDSSVAERRAKKKAKRKEEKGKQKLLRRKSKRTGSAPQA
jgi:hypothetical protein